MFKEYVAKDIDTFINLDEFSESVVINDVSVKVVEDYDKLEYRIKKDYDGLIIGDVLFYISELEYAKIPRVPTVPKTDVAIKYDGAPCLIMNVNKQMGIYEIILQRTGR